MSVIDFMMEHPWMTFFVAITIAYGVADGIRYLCLRNVIK